MFIVRARKTSPYGLMDSVETATDGQVYRLLVHVTHLRGQLRLLNSLTNPDVHMLNSSWKLIYASHPVLELRVRREENKRAARR